MLGVTASLWQRQEMDHELNPREKCPDTEIRGFACACAHTSSTLWLRRLPKPRLQTRLGKAAPNSFPPNQSVSQRQSCARAGCLPPAPGSAASAALASVPLPLLSAGSRSGWGGGGWGLRCVFYQLLLLIC